MEPKLLKSIAEQLAKFSSEDYTDDEIDESLFNTYPELQSKDNYDEHGGYVRGSTYRNFIREMADLKAPRGELKYYANLAHNFLDTATFGFGKKVAALTASVMYDRDYDEVYDSLTETENEFSEHRPVDAIASRVAGGFTPGPAMVAKAGYNLLSKTPFLGKILNPKSGQTALNIAKETAKSVPVGMGESALYTAGTSGSLDEFGERVLPEMVATGVGSAGMTPLAMGVGKIAGSVARLAGKSKGKDLPPGVSRTDDDRALEVMSKARESGFSDDQIKAEIERIRKIDPDLAERLVQMDVGGDPFVGTTMGAMGTPGGGQAIGVGNITPFFKQQVERLQKFSARTLLKKDSVSEFRADVKARRIKAGKMYDDLWNKIKRTKDKNGKSIKTRGARNTVPDSAKTTIKFDEGSEQVSLAEILDPNKPTVRKAMVAAQQLADEARVILPQPGT